MLYKKAVKSIAVAGLIVGLVGCSSSHKHMANREDPNVDYPLTGTEKIAEAIDFYEEELSPAEENRLLSTNTLYFKFDNFEVSPENKKVILAHARKLIKNPNLKLRVDGHADERGSREYNIGLGERRAKAVARVLAVKGIPQNRVVTVSYGKEKPAVLGSDEISWSKNRRAELEFEGK